VTAAGTPVNESHQSPPQRRRPTLLEGHIPISPPPGIPVWDIDPYADETLLRLEEYYADLRERGALVYIPRYAVLACGRYRETREIFSDWKRFVSSRGVGLTDFMHAEPWRRPSLILEVDPPYHDKTRRVLVRALSARALGSLRETLQRTAEHLIDTLVKKGSFDAVTELAELYPTTVFPAAVGLQEIDTRRLVDYGAMTFNALGPDNELRRQSLARAAEVVPWITEQCRRQRLRSEGFGAVIYAAADGGEITEEEAGMLVRSLLSAGIDTTITGLGNAVWCLAQNPESFQQLRADPSLARAAFDETLRLTSPVHTFCRTASGDTEVGGHAIPRDAKILCVLGAANLDPEHWTEPARFDLARKNRDHLAFGVGTHACVGQAVSKIEAEAVLGAIARKVSSIELAATPKWRAGNAIHALESLPVTFRSA
jgi:4-methoxybenzoate monooxygenase (O-demethylating)